MTLQANGKTFEISERGAYWRAVWKNGALRVEYKIEKALCPDEAALRRYIEENGL